MTGPQYLFHVDPKDAATEGSELAIQTAFRNKMKTHAPDVMLVAVPNSGKRTSYETLTRAREGMVSGFPDMIALHDGKAAFLEFKARGGRLDDKQIDCLNRLTNRNFVAGVFRSPVTAMDWLRDHGFPVQ